MKKILTCVLAFMFIATGYAQDAIQSFTEVQSFKAGGTPIAIPTPTENMVEVGYDNREVMDILVPTNNRLLAAFIPSEDLQEFSNGGDDFKMSRYAMIQVPRRGEYMDCGASDFKVVAEMMNEQFESVMHSSAIEVEEEFNRRMKSLDFDDVTLDLGQPVQLGCLFSKKDAYGFGMIMPVSVGGESVIMAMGGSLVRAKKRLLFVYLYAEYQSENTVRWLRETTERWADAILRANE